MKFSTNALINIEYYRNMMGIDSLEQGTTEKIIGTINFVSNVFERFCNRTLKAQDFDYAETIIVDDVVIANPVYSEKYAIFDGVNGNDFYFPTYPVNSVTTFLLNGDVITEATDYDDFEGYHLYNSRGKLIYYGGFYPGYYRNIKFKWNGGYKTTDAEMEELKFLCFDMVKTLMNTPLNSNLASERIGNYAYTNYSPSALKELQGLNATVFAGLKRYRKEVI